MRRTVISIAAAAVVAFGMSACGGTSRLLVRTSATTTAVAKPTTTTTTTATGSTATTSAPGPSASQYVAELRAKEQALGAAERKIPANAKTPRALAHSATLLAAAVAGLAQGLATIQPPAKVATEHAHLVTVARTYAAQLRSAATMAARRGKLASAGALLISATTTASTQFSTTLTKIYSTLGVRQP
jgi:hypothetical protein